MKTQTRKTGQVMALGAITMLVLALMLMFSFSLTRAVHEKIRLQSHADAMTYSMATVGARAMNYYAYSNRATAACAVSVMTLHAYHSAMMLTGQFMQAGVWTFVQILVWEIAEFASTCPACQFQHIPHIVQAGVAIGRFQREANRYNRALRNIEGRFNLAVRAYSMMIDGIWATQQSVTLHTANVLRGATLDSLHDINAPCASQLPPLVAAMNVREFACALEGSPIDITCVGGRARSPAIARSRVIGNVSNAARGEYPRGRTIPLPSLMHPQALQQLANGIQRQGFSIPVLSQGTAKAIQGTTLSECIGTAANRPGHTICGTDQGILTSFFIDSPPGFFMFDTEIYSNNAGGRHNGPASTHQGRHNMWHGFQRNDNLGTCLTAGECFVNFRSDPRPAEDFGQPKVFGVFQQNLRETWRCQRGPWEVGKDGVLKLGDGARGEGVLDFLPNEPATAVSKSLIYFHRPDDWQMPPNAFDPYWKAKLHPMRNTEAAAALTAAGALDDAAMALGGPVDGRDP